MDELDMQLKTLEIQKLQLEINELGIQRRPVSSWNSLEIVKLIVSLLLPIVLLIITTSASSSLKEIEANQKDLADQNKTSIENNKRIYDLRFSIYQQIGFRLNEVYCYFTYVGKWKELSPPRLIEDKRACDEIMYTNQSLFNPEFFNAYNNFMGSAYNTYSGQGEDAKLKTELKFHKDYYKLSPWENNWNGMFKIDENSDELSIRKDIQQKYDSVLTLLTKELNVKEIVINTKFKDHKPS